MAINKSKMLRNLKDGTLTPLNPLIRMNDHKEFEVVSIETDKGIECLDDDHNPISWREFAAQKESVVAQKKLNIANAELEASKPKAKAKAKAKTKQKSAIASDDANK